MQVDLDKLIADPTFVANGQIKDSTFVECLRWNNLVYLRTLKCASEFFYRNFNETANWIPINWTDINWGFDHVFSYIMDPIRRRHKGVAEFLIANGLVESFFNNPEVKRIVSHVPFLDEHSAGLHTIYSSRCNMIDWIPISNNHSEGIKYTEYMLKYFKHPPIVWNMNFIHTTDCYMKELYEEIQAVWNSTFNTLAVRYYFEQELNLFARVHCKFNPTGNTWDKISWLSNI